MFADFFENYYPPSLHVWRHITYLRSLVDLTPSTPVLERARRTIGLIHLASATQDTRLVREARVSYGRLLGMLQFTLTFPSKIRSAQETRELVASIALLTHISDIPGDDASRDDSWATHVQAAQALFTTYVPLSLPAADHLDHGLMRHTLMNGFFLALAKRKSWVVDPAWLVSIKSIGWTEMVRACHRLPGLLAETDELLASRADATSLVALVARLEDARAKARGLYLGAQKPTLVDASSCPQALCGEAEEHVVMAESTAFPELYAPLTGQGISEALRFCFKAMLQLIVECTILRIWHFRPKTLFVAPTIAWAVAEERAYVMARELCKIALSFTQSTKVRPLTIQLPSYERRGGARASTSGSEYLADIVPVRARHDAPPDAHARSQRLRTARPAAGAGLVRCLPHREPAPHTQDPRRGRADAV